MKEALAVRRGSPKTHALMNKGSLRRGFVVAAVVCLLLLGGGGGQTFAVPRGSGGIHGPWRVFSFSDVCDLDLSVYKDSSVVSEVEAQLLS